jgi:hypothetical protein
VSKVGQEGWALKDTGPDFIPFQNQTTTRVALVPDLAWPVESRAWSPSTVHFPVLRILLRHCRREVKSGERTIRIDEVVAFAGPVVLHASIRPAAGHSMVEDVGPFCCMALLSLISVLQVVVA